MRNKKIFIVGLILIFSIVFIARSCGRPEETHYAFTRARKGTVVELISAVGNVLPTASVEVFSSIKGRVTAVYVANGDDVDTGDNLFKTYNPVSGVEDIVTSPAHGTAANLSIGKGSRVETPPSVAGTANIAPALLIADVSILTVKLAINEVDVNKIRKGEKATVAFDAVNDKTFAGEVDRVDSVGTNTQGVITYNVYINLSDPPDELKPAMTANVDIEVAKRADVLTLPNASLKPYKGGKAVLVLNKRTGKTRYLPVDIGIAGSLRTEITGGLKEGREVVTGALSPGRRGLLQMGRGGG